MATEKIEIQRHYVMVRNYHSVALIPVKSVLPFHLSLSLSVYLYLSTPIPLVKFLSDICLPLTPDITVSLSLSRSPIFRIQDNHACSTAKPPRLLSINCILAAPTLHWPVTPRASPLFRYIHRDMDGQRRATCSLVYLYIYLAHLLCIANDRKRAEVLIDFSTRRKEYHHLEGNRIVEKMKK